MGQAAFGWPAHPMVRLAFLVEREYPWLEGNFNCVDGEVR
jgi:hypothetical protein